MQILKPRNLAVFLGPYSSYYSNACFHSTPTSFSKWKGKWDEARGRGEEPSKNYVRYATRLKRANAKNGLKNLLSKSTSNFSFQAGHYCTLIDRSSSASVSLYDAVGSVCQQCQGGLIEITVGNSHSHSYCSQDGYMLWSADGWEQKQRKNLDGTNKEMPSKQFSGHSKSRNSSHQAGSSQQNRNKRKSRKRRSSSDYLEQDETIFQATFGTRCYTWSFRSSSGHQFQNSTWGFEWRDDFNWGGNRTKEDSDTDDTDDDDDNDETSFVGSSSDRKILGLPLVGPLKMEDVKSAFRTYALKWHPDKHQGSSQAFAEEKFKLCVNAYKSLCSALSSG